MAKCNSLRATMHFSWALRLATCAPTFMDAIIPQRCTSAHTLGLLFDISVIFPQSLRRHQGAAMQ
eukprot:4097549-Amphidinium_carterae.1